MVSDVGGEEGGKARLQIKLGRGWQAKRAGSL